MGIIIPDRIGSETESYRFTFIINSFCIQLTTDGTEFDWIVIEQR